MWVLLAFVCSIIPELDAFPLNNSRPYDDDCSEDSFAQFQIDHNKTSSADDTARRMRLCEIIEENKQHNAGNNSFSRRINAMGDLTPEEYSKRLGFIPNPSAARKKREWIVFEYADYPSDSAASAEDNLPDSLDWRTSGYVSEVKNQGECGGCWAFSATGSLEGQLAKKRGNMTSLSEQNLIDCSTQNYGCDGGNTALALNYVKTNKGIDTEDGYPFKGTQGRCRYSTADIGGEDTGYVSVPSGDEEALKKAVATIGPVSVAIDASSNAFAYYATGVFYLPSCSSYDLDHAVLVIGYGTDPSYGDYWLIKNSWGTTWGEDGYGKMARNRNNNCGIATEAVYPKV